MNTQFQKNSFSLFFLLVLICISLSSCTCNGKKVEEPVSTIGDTTTMLPVTSADTAIPVMEHFDTAGVNFKSVSDSAKYDVHGDEVMPKQMAKKKKIFTVSKAKKPQLSVDEPLIQQPDNTLSAKPKSALFGYSYFKKMRRHEVRDINAYVSISNPKSFILDTLKAIVSEQINNLSDTSLVDIKMTNVILYKMLTVSLVDPAGDFTITPIHPSARQTIDTVNGNHWRWSVKTNTDKKQVTMILNATATRPDGTEDKFNARTIIIAVQIDQNIIRRFFNYLSDNPEVSIPILVSLIGFIGWLIKYRLEKRKG